VDLLLSKGGPEVVRARDSRGDLPLHMAAQQGHPMCIYNLAKVRAGVSKGQYSYLLTTKPAQ
jgi:ankyrin repeat protein